MKKMGRLLIILLFGYNLMAQNTSTFDTDLLLGKITLLPSDEGFSLLPEAAIAFEKMQTAAKGDSIDLKIVSSFRSYEAQKRIWNRKYQRFTEEGLTGPQAILKIIEYSTLPGTSRHHWGTDIDLIDGSKKVLGDVLLEEHFHQGAYQKLRLWLQKNAAHYGYGIVYTKDSLRKGFLYEPWHYSYMPLAKQFLKTYHAKELIFTIALDSTLLGKEFITTEFMQTYYSENVLGINPELKQ